MNFNMGKNSNLHKAKKERNDEFYTQLTDIEKEIQHYNLDGMKIYCNCDDYRISNFVKYFKDNFDSLKISHLTASNYDNGLGAYRYNFDGVNETITNLQGNGDFRSEECIALLKEADVVITNPPFSLFREYVAQLMEYNKKFLIIGNMNAVNYLCPLVKENKLWYGQSISSGDRAFYVPDNYELNAATCGIDKDGKRFIRVKGVRWFTNIDNSKRHEPLDLFKKYSAEEYPKYDNYDAINCDKTSDIPMDYDGVIGAPITFLDKYCPEQFEIIGITYSTDRNEDIEKIRTDAKHRHVGIINGKEKYPRILIRRKK